jgi:hypothetical protein
VPLRVTRRVWGLTKQLDEPGNYSKKCHWEFITVRTTPPPPPNATYRPHDPLRSVQEVTSFSCCLVYTLLVQKEQTAGSSVIYTVLPSFEPRSCGLRFINRRETHNWLSPCSILKQLTFLRHDDNYGHNQQHSTQDSIPQSLESEPQTNLNHDAGTHTILAQMLCYMSCM